MISFLYEETAFGNLSSWGHTGVSVKCASRSLKLNKNPIGSGKTLMCCHCVNQVTLIPFRDEIALVKDASAYLGDAADGL